MSRQLPPQPSLEHLKKQAKALFRCEQGRRPDWKLADAQHATARAYGFASWPLLKHHVESIAAGGDGREHPGPREAPSSRAPAPGPPGSSPFDGTWSANLARSTRHPAQRFRSATLTIHVNGDRLTFTQYFVDDTGQEVGGTMTITANGQPQPFESGAGHALVARWLTPRTLEALDTRAGEVVGRGTYEVSEDGRSLTVLTDTQALVFEKL